MAKRKRWNTGQFKEPTISEAIEDAIRMLVNACECDGRGCGYCIASDNLQSVQSKVIHG